MSKYDLLIELLPILEQYEAQRGKHQEMNPTDFLSWWNQHFMQQPLHHEQETAIAPFPPTQKSLEELPPEAKLTVQARAVQLLIVLNKYIKFYLKKGFNNQQIKTTDDFGFLASLMSVESLTKTELIQRNYVEMPSGMEVIKRLKRYGFVHTFPDPNDGRATRVTITPKGKEQFFQVLPALQEISQLAMGNMNEPERRQLLFLMQKLHLFHKPIFEEEKKSDWKDIAANYLR